MRATPNPVTKFGLLLLALSLWAPAGAPAQVKDEFRDEIPSLGPSKTPPTPTPKTPDGAPPDRAKPDPRKSTKVPVKPAPVPGRTRVAPAGIQPSDVRSLPKSDLGVRLLAARVVPGARYRTEVEVEVTNHGPDAFDSQAMIHVHVFPEDDGLCRWPHGTGLEIPDLRSRQRKVLVFRAGHANSQCGAPGTRRPDRSGARATASIERYGIEFQDRNPTNDSSSSALLDLLPKERPVAAQPVQIVVRLIQPTYIGRGTVELDWLSVELGGDADRADHPRLRVMGQSDRNKPNHLAVKGGESVLVGPRAFLVKDEVRPGEQVVLRIRARDRDCAGNRDCRRGNTGEFRSVFRVPTFRDGAPSGCEEQTWRLRDLPGYRFEFGSKPHFSVGDEGDPAEVCFESVGR